MEEKKYTRDQIKDAIWQELQESDYAGENNDRAYEVIGIVMAGVDKIVVSDVQPSAVWVKASRFKYEEGASYHAKDSESKGAGRFNKDGAFIWGNGTITWPEHRDDLLILDESGTAAGREEFIQRIGDFNLSDVDAPVFTHTKEFAAHFSYIKGKLMDMLKVEGIAGREEAAVAFAEWLDKERNEGGSNWKDMKIWGKETAFKLMHELFKQQKEK